MNEQTHRIYANADIGNRLAQFPKTHTSTPSGIGALAAQNSNACRQPSAENQREHR